MSFNLLTFNLCVIMVCHLWIYTNRWKVCRFSFIFCHVENASVGLWGLVNNAALNLLGDAELTTMEQYANQFNINQLGVVRVTKAFLPEIRRRKGSDMALISLQ